MMKSSKQGKKSITQFEVIEAFRKHTLLKATSWTERYHQVRTHLYCKQLPIVGDALYGGDLLMLCLDLFHNVQTEVCGENPVAEHTKEESLQHVSRRRWALRQALSHYIA